MLSSLRVSFMLPFRAFTLLGWLAGSLTLTVIADDSSWSHRYPPPVKVAPLVRPNVQQASHVDGAVAVNHGQWANDELQNIPENYQYAVESAIPWGSPPHRIIQAPAAKKPSQRQPTGASQRFSTEHYPAATNSPAGHGFHQGGAAPVSAHQGHSVHGRSIHGPLIPTMPGVENDPSGAGPGRIGLGTHWIKNYPQHRPSIPHATVAPRWKTPYSYGHFGAEGKRNWTRQHGYRDRYLQWTLR